MNKKPLVINLLAGPGCGKSTSAAAIFSELKWAGINCELANEYAKTRVWQGDLAVLYNQIYVFGKQHQTVHRLLSQVECIITDSPLLLSLVYGKHMSEAFKTLVLEEYNKLNSLNFYLTRKKEYNPKGRTQTFEQAKEKDDEVLAILRTYNIPFSTVEGSKDGVNYIVTKALEYLKTNEVIN